MISEEVVKMTGKSLLSQLTDYEEVECLLGKKVTEVYEVDDKSIIIKLQKSDKENYVILINDDGLIYFGIEKLVSNEIEEKILYLKNI